MTFENKIDKLKKISSITNGKRNIVDYLTDNREVQTDPIDEMISYDIRSGEETRELETNSDFFEFNLRVSDKILSYMSELNLERFSLLECGCGEGSKLINIVNESGEKVKWAGGIDISWSRCKYAKAYNQKYGKHPDKSHFYMADICHLPFEDNSIDIVYTMQSIAEMGGAEKPLMTELYRVASRYLIIIEPSYELANEGARLRMTKLNYVKGLPYVAKLNGYEIIKNEPFEVDLNLDNPAAVLIIKKKEDAFTRMPFVCDPISRGSFETINNVLYCDESKLSYPIIDDIPCLVPDNAILTSKIKLDL